MVSPRKLLRTAIGWPEKQPEVTRSLTWPDYTRFVPPLGSAYSSFAGAYVSEQTTLGIPAAWRCVTLIADAIASSPLQAFKSDRVIAPTPALLKRPNQTMTRSEFLFSMVVSLLLRGNAYLLLGDFDNLMYPRQLDLIHPDDMAVYRNPDGTVTYRVKGIEIPAALIKHVRGFTLPGCPVGLGVVEAHREALSHGISLNEFAARYFTEGAVPPVALVAPTANPDAAQKETMAQLQEQWVANHGRSRKPPVLWGGLDVKPLGFNPEQSQYLESRQFHLIEIAQMFGVPPHFIGAIGGDTATYKNVQDEFLTLAKLTLRPWMIRMEEALSDLLPRGTEVQFNMDAILRASTNERYAAYTAALTAGWLTVDEVRAQEGYDPLPPDPEPEPSADDPIVDLDIDDDQGGTDA